VAIGSMIHIGLSPVFTALAEYLMSGARLTARWLATTLLAIGGCAALVLGGRAGAGPQLVVGVVAAAASSIGYSLFTVCSARVIRAGGDSTAVMATVFSGTALGLAPLLLLFPVGWMLTTPRRRGRAVHRAGDDVRGYCLYGFGRHTPASTAAVLVLAEPATAAALAVTLLGEHLGLLGGAGLAAVFAALTLGASPPRVRALPAGVNGSGPPSRRRHGSPAGYRHRTAASSRGRR
jgi:drug/metabolite transporter, DME family